MPLDVSDPAAAERAVRTVTEAAGRLDVLVNNAGSGILAPLEETADAEAHRTFEVNVFGPMRLARAVLPAMRAQGSGRIVNVTSVNDIAPAPFGGWYSASKAALASLSVVLGAELYGSGRLRDRDRPRAVPDRDVRAASLLPGRERVRVRRGVRDAP